MKLGHILFLEKVCDYTKKTNRNRKFGVETEKDIMDSNTLEFVTYCISKLSALLGLSQSNVYHRLKTSGILYGYIVPSYDVLHTFSSRYLMEDLMDFMKEKGVFPQ